jgi:hypothetical protein
MALKEDCLEEDPEKQEVSPPDYDYLWHGALGPDGAIHGAECTKEYGTIQPPNEDHIRRIVADIRKSLSNDT